jgi:hypothetical protein
MCILIQRQRTVARQFQTGEQRADNRGATAQPSLWRITFDGRQKARERNSIGQPEQQR